MSSLAIVLTIYLGGGALGMLVVLVATGVEAWREQR